MTKHIFIYKDEKLKDFAKEYGLDPAQVFTDFSVKNAMSRDLPLGEYDEVIIHDLPRNLNIKITHERIS